MIKVIVAMILMIILTGCNKVGEPVSPEAIKAVAETCKEQDKQVRVYQTRSQIRIYCE